MTIGRPWGSSLPTTLRKSTGQDRPIFQAQPIIRTKIWESMMNNTQGQKVCDGPKVPMALYSDREISDELDFGECLSENDWLLPLLMGKVVAELGCSIGLRAAYLAPHAHQALCTDPDIARAAIARETLRLNHCDNARVVRELAVDSPVDMLIIDTRRYKSITLPRLNRQPEKLVVFGSLSRSFAAEVMDLGYRHQPQFHRAAVFSKIRGHHGLQ